MSSTTLESEAAFKERAAQIGVEKHFIDKFVEKKFAAFGRYAFAIVYSPHSTDERPLRQFLVEMLEEEPSLDQMSCLRRLFFESHTMALTDARQRVEASPDPSIATRKLATAERVARQREQEVRLGGLVFTPETIPANHLVDLFVEMMETGVLSYIKPELCCSRAQEIGAQEIGSVKKDPAVQTDAAGMLKLGTKSADPVCEANAELKLRACWQRRNLAMDMAGLVSFDVIEGWVQFLFSQLMREQPRGFSKISLQQLLDCDRYLFTLASHRTMGNLQKGADQSRPLDATIEALRESTEVLQYLTPLPAARVHEAPAASGSRPEKFQKTEKPAKGRGSFSKAATQAGLRVVSVDHEVVQPFAPIVALDLTTKAGVDIMWDILNTPGVGAIHLGLPCGTSSRATEALAAQGKQNKRHRPLVPEYHRIMSLAPGDQPPPGSKLLPPHFSGGGVHEEWTADVDNGDSVDTLETNRADGKCKQADSQKYGIYHTPLQFLSRAQQVQHPMDSTDHLEEPTKFALDFNFRFPGDVVKLERRKNLLQAKLLAARMAEDEKKLRSELPHSLQKVLEGKRLLVWKALLEKYQYDDMGVTAFVFEGVKLVGAHDTPPCFPPMVRPATLTAEGLEASSVWRRRAIVGRVAASDPAHVEHLEESS
eukprot:s2122_g2.t1